MACVFLFAAASVFWSRDVSIVVSIPTCHEGDPGSIPGREALLFEIARTILLYAQRCGYSEALMYGFDIQ